MPEVMNTIRRQVESYDPAVLRARIVELGQDEFIDGLCDALKPRVKCEHCRQRSGYQRWAFKLWAEVTKLKAPDANVLITIMNRVGVRDEDELQALVESGKRLQHLERDADAALPEFRDEAVELLRLVLQERPEWRGEVLLRLGAGMPETNGVSG